MNLHYLKMARRAMSRHPGLSLINVLGLSIGIASCLLIYGYVSNELSYDTYHPKADRIARVTSILHSAESDLTLATSPVQLAGWLLRDCPELEGATRIQPATFVIRKVSGEVLAAKDFCYSEQSVFDLFFFSFVEGAAAGALAAPNSIVLTRSAATQYLGSGPALGKVLICNNIPYRVTAVIADRPVNSDIPINALVSKDYTAITYLSDDDFELYTFLLFRREMDLRRFNVRLPGLIGPHMQPELDQAALKEYTFKFEAEALADVHFSKGKLEDTPKGNRAFDSVFSVLAGFILLIALLNYINLSTARAAERAKEVGVRKAIGAGRGQLVRQFLGESAVLMVIAWLVAFGLVAGAIPLFNRVLSTNLSPGGWRMGLLLALVFPLVTFLAGGYPALVLSRFSPVKALKGIAERDSMGVGLRKVLTLVQFVIALAMLAGTAVLYSQMRFVEHTDTGVDRAQVICIPIPNDSVSRSGAVPFFQALRQEAGIEGMTIGSGMPSEGYAVASTTAFSQGKKRILMNNYFLIDPQFLPLLHIRLEAGRNFSDSFPTDRKESFLVNESFVKTMGWKSSGVGESLEGYGNKGRVIGVVKNFFYKSLHNAIEPLVMIYRTDPPPAVLVKAPPGKLFRLGQLWKRYIPSKPFDHYFLDEDFDAQYKKDRMTLLLFDVFAGLAILISCLGLYGLVSLITLQRTKEIGIRKVLGASLSQLVALLTKDLLWLVGWSALIALPLAAMGAHRWLSSYAYHITMTVWMFALPVVVILLLALVVTGYRILRTALVNPAESLRLE